ncbi:hypothetical protein HB364_08670 [Pseudoflavitalea sp. X16]|uniref:hypothetical protein n=1 Tax=Paraflavitalea devenefica TaxID=2716334 RepID=UPI0014238062|nr:hypothetical protein [Paraflavitalea devenefica]NII25150.1 hypothetical protein [Paraflavitalea devenefica]
MLMQVKDVPFSVRVRETNAFIREIPYKDQPKKAFGWPVDFDFVASHALHNHYCISFLNCPFRLDFDNLLAHFDWCCKYLYFNFEQSVLRIEIFTRLEELRLSHDKIEYMVQVLARYPMAYSYNLENADFRQKWALLKKSNFQKCHTFRQIVDIDRTQRLLLAEQFRAILDELKVTPPAEHINPRGMSTPVMKLIPNNRTAPRREREASLYNFLKLNEDFSPELHQKVIDHLYNLLEPCFRNSYTRKNFALLFTSEESSVLELIKKSTWDNQCFAILFRELKKEKVLQVSWLVIDKKVRVYKSEGDAFSGFSDVSNGKIDAQKRNRVRKAIEPLLTLIRNELAPAKRK